MASPLALAILLIGCEAEPQLPLVLDGPARVTVDRLGRVEGPLAHLDGGEAVAVSWSATPTTVAHVMENEVHAVGPGEAVVTGAWKEQTISWTLVVQPTVTLRLVEPPSKVKIGESVDLKVEGRSGDQVMPIGDVEWSTSDPAVLTVDGPKVTGVSAGLVYVTARGRRSEAMLELRVVE